MKITGTSHHTILGQYEVCDISYIRSSIAPIFYIYCQMLSVLLDTKLGLLIYIQQFGKFKMVLWYKIAAPWTSVKLRRFMASHEYEMHAWNRIRSSYFFFRWYIA